MGIIYEHSAANSTALQRVLDALPDHKRTGEGKYQARCPAHEDRSPSLSITESSGTVLLKCFAGCSADAVVKALGLQLKDLFSDQPFRSNGHSKAKSYVTLDEARNAAHYSVNKDKAGSTFTKMWQYADVAGKIVAAAGRWDSPSGKTFRPFSRHLDGWRTKDPPGQWPLYRLNELENSDLIFLAEGEKCVDSFFELGLAATTTAHGAQSPHKTDLTPLAGRDVIIVPDADAPGEKYANTVAALLQKLSPPAKVRILPLPGLNEGEDIVEFIERRREDGKEDSSIVQEIMDLLPGYAKESPPEPSGTESPPPPTFVPVDVCDLMVTFPNLRTPVVEGLLREGEILNLIAATKIGKSWLSMFLAYAVALGIPWLGFPTIKGNVLIIDNELHPETLASRLRRVAQALQIDLEQIKGRIQVIPLRGNLQNIYLIGAYLLTLAPGSLNLIIVDAQYRTMPDEFDENSNAGMAKIYNALDHFAGHLKAAFVLIHHASKGDQSGKQTTDVGSGAGAMSRAADSHCILRAHESENVVVLDAVCRSWPPIAPRALRWNFPLFAVDAEADPTALKNGRGRTAGNDDVKRQAAKQKQAEKEADQETRLLDALDQVADAQGIAGYSRVRGSAGLGGQTMEMVVFRLVRKKLIEEVPTEIVTGNGSKKEARGLRRKRDD